MRDHAGRNPLGRGDPRQRLVEGDECRGDQRRRSRRADHPPRTGPRRAAPRPKPVDGRRSRQPPTPGPTSRDRPGTVWAARRTPVRARCPSRGAGGQRSWRARRCCQSRHGGSGRVATAPPRRRRPGLSRAARRCVAAWPAGDRPASRDPGTSCPSRASRGAAPGPGPPGGAGAPRRRPRCDRTARWRGTSWTAPDRSHSRRSRVRGAGSAGGCRARRRVGWASKAPGA